MLEKVRQAELLHETFKAEYKTPDQAGGLPLPLGAFGEHMFRELRSEESSLDESVPHSHPSTK
jgi:hypothetical protein